MTSQHHIAQALDSTAVRKILDEPTGAAKIFRFHCKTNILHSVFTFKPRIQVTVFAVLLNSLVFTVALLATVNVNAEPSVKKTQLQVKQLKKALAKLQTQITAERSKRSGEERAIQKNEQDIAALGSQISKIEVKQRQLKTDLSGFMANKSKIEQQLSAHRRRLALLLKQRYQLADHTPIKLLLNQESPQQASRMLMYLDIIGDFEAAQVEAFEAVLVRQQDNDVSIGSTQTQLSQQRESLEEKRRLVKGKRERRKQNILAINRNIELKKTEYKRLAADKKRLEKVIARIEKVIVQTRALARAIDNRSFKTLQGKLKWPAAGRIVRSFGSIENKLAYDGVLIRAAHRSPVTAVHSGHVVFADWLRSYGMLLIIDHGAGYLTLYGHNDQLNKTVGEQVSSGEVIALVGNSGGNTRAGLYFAIRRDGQTTNPRRWLLAR